MLGLSSIRPNSIPSLSRVNLGSVRAAGVHRPTAPASYLVMAGLVALAAGAFAQDKFNQEWAPQSLSNAAQNALHGEGQVSQILDNGQVLVDLGYANGLREGRLLPVYRDARQLGFIEIVEVMERRARCLAGKPLRVQDRVTLSLPVAVQGSCADEQGNLLANVEVGVFREHANWVDEPSLVAVTRTDSEGKFDFDQIHARPLVHGSDLVLAARLEGYASVRRKVDVHEKNWFAELELSSDTGHLVGIVLTPEGQPLENALVYPPTGYSPIPGIYQAITDAKGKYTIFDRKRSQPGNRQVAYPLIISHPDYAKTTVRYSRVPEIVNAKLAPPALIRGRVTDRVSGEVVPGALVSAQGVSESGWYQVRSEADGKFELVVTADKYNIWSEMEGRIAIAVDSVEAVPGQITQDANIELVRGAICFGFLLDAAGKPMEPVGPLSVGHYGPARPRSGAAVTSTRVAPDGSYRLRVAPGSNYLYIMSANHRSSTTVRVEDGQELEVHLREGGQVRGNNRDLPNPEPKWQPSRQRENTPVGQLLDKLEQQNAGQVRFQDPWLQTLKQLVDLDQAAVAELCAELDATESDMMMRCMGFVLRAIGDPRAAPSLIRAIPKTLLKPGSDMGLQAEDKTLIAFAQQHDLQEQNFAEGGYGFARPVREILRALQVITGHKENDEQLFNIFLQGTERQKLIKRTLFQRHARKWADWWQEHAAEMKVPREYATAHLPLFDSVDVAPDLPPDRHYKVGSGGGNWMLESVFQPQAKRTFLDLDSGRTSNLPARWREQLPTPPPTDEIQAWAEQEGFDMMGTELHVEGQEQPVYAIRLLGMQAWELDKSRWKMRSNDITLEELLTEGRPVDDFLFHQNFRGQPVHEDTASFLVLTREGTPALVFLGIQVHDDSLQAGGVAQGDNELRPIAFRKGRRFAFNFFEEK